MKTNSINLTDPTAKFRNLSAASVVGEQIAVSGPKTITYSSGTEVKVPVMVAPFPMMVTGCRIIPATTQAASDSNYWIVMLRRYRKSLPVTSYATEVLADSPAHYWKLNDASNPTTLADAGSLNQALTPTATKPTMQQTGLVRQSSDKSALFVRSSSTGASVTNTIDFSGNAFTIEALIQLNTLPSSSVRQFIYHRGPTGDPAIEAGGSSNPGALCQSSPGAFQYQTGDYVVLPGNVYHVCFRRQGSSGNAGTQSWWINGVKQTYFTQTIAAVASGAASSGLTSLGGRLTDSTSFFDGYIDDVAVYLTALSDTRIQAHATAGAPMTEISRKTTRSTISSGHMPSGEGMIAYQSWAMDENPFDSYTSLLEQGDSVIVAFYPVGTPSTLTDCIIQVTYEPI